MKTIGCVAAENRLPAVVQRETVALGLVEIGDVDRRVPSGRLAGREHFCEPEQIRSRASSQLVRHPGVVDRELVVAGTAIEHIGVGHAVDLAIRRQHVIAVAAVQKIGASPVEEVVVAGAAEQLVVAVATIQVVVAVAAVQLIAAAVADDVVELGRSNQDVVDVAAVDVRHAPLPRIFWNRDDIGRTAT